MIHYKQIFDNSDIFDCFSGAVSTLCAYDDFPYEPIFSSNSYFDFDRDLKSESDLIGGRIKFDNNILSILKNYLKVEVINYNYPSDEAEPFIQAQIKAQRPFIILFDTFYAPWLPDYKKLHSLHSSIAQDYTVKSELICIDTFPAGRNLIFPMDDWKKANLEFICLNFTSRPNQNIIYKMFSDGLQNVFKEKTSFDNIRDYAQLLYTDFDIEKENHFKNEEYWSNSKFFRDLLYIAKARYGYSVFLSYMQVEFKQLNIASFIDEFIKLSMEWRSVVLILWKQCMKNRNEGINLFLRDAFLKLADRETVIFTKLFDFMMNEKEKYQTLPQ